MISASPDDRTTTARLAELVDELEQRPHTRVAVWFLRTAWDETPWPGSRVVDDLRTWIPAKLARLIVSEHAAAALQGLRLRWWLHGVQPDVVVLDDGLGERLLDHAPPHAKRIVRLNPVPPADLRLEEPLSSAPDGAMVHPGVAVDLPPSTEVIVVASESRDRSFTTDYADPELYRRLRSSLELPVTEPLLVGWGDDGWLDGPDLFVRALWFLEQRHGILAHGAWFGIVGDPHEEERLRAEAVRCGVGDRFHLRPANVDAPLIGDVIFLPHRSPEAPGEEIDMLNIAATGAAIVAFPIFDAPDESIRVVDHLDLEGAAAGIAEFMGTSREDRAAEARRRLDVRGVADFVLAIGRGAR